MIVDIVDKYCTNDNNPIKKPTLENSKKFLQVAAMLELVDKKQGKKIQ